MKTNIVTIVGPWACGRKTLARELHRRLPEHGFSELNVEIAGQRLTDEQAHRHLREEKIRVFEILKARKKYILLPSRACYLDNQSRVQLLQHSAVIALIVELDEVKERIRKNSRHPQWQLLHEEPRRFDALYESHQLKYAEAHCSIVAQRCDVADVVDDILYQVPRLPEKFRMAS